MYFVNTRFILTLFFLLFSLYNFFNHFYFLFFFSVWVIFTFFSFSWSGLYFFFDSYTFILLVCIRLLILAIVLFTEFNYSLLFLTQILVLVRVFFFFSGTLFCLYIYFELSLFPIILIILGYGSQIEKISSSFYLLFYASFCSFPFLFVFFYYFLNYHFVYFDRLISWELVFILTLSFIIKFPVYFLHLWLPKAHVEAPTSARILLAGLLLKLGTAGFFRIIKTFSFVHINFWFFISFLGIILGSFACAFQSDSKSLAAYSSITHMGFVLLCLVLLSLKTKFSSLLLILAHGYTSTLIFFFIGEFYHTSSTRIVYYLNSFLNVGLFICILFTFTFLSNAGIPPSFSFFSEFVTIRVSLVSFYFIFFLLFIYFFFAFYYSIYFITNFFIGKNYLFLGILTSSCRFFFVILIFNIFWLSVFL